MNFRKSNAISPGKPDDSAPAQRGTSTAAGKAPSEKTVRLFQILYWFLAGTLLVTGLLCIFRCLHPGLFFLYFLFAGNALSYLGGKYRLKGLRVLLNRRKSERK